MAPIPPQPRRIPHTLSLHGDVRADDWYWLRDRDDPAVITHLERENAYADAVLQPMAALRDRIFNEIRERVQETDESAPVPLGPWEYTSRTVEGLQYPIHLRRPRRDTVAEPVVLLDENACAEGHDFFALGGFELTPDQQVLAYSVDVTGGERFTLRFRDLTTGSELPDVIEDVTYGLAWSDDGRTCFYMRPDEAERPYEVWRHTLGTPPADDVLVYREEDERYFVEVHRTRSNRFILITCGSKMTSEVWFIPSESPTSEPRVVAPREEGHEYLVEHHWSEERGDRFLIVTNQGGKARNFELVAAPCVDPERQYWTPIVPHREDVKLDAVTAFAEHLVLSERANGLDRLSVMRTEDGDMHVITFPDPVFAAWVGPNEEYNAATLRYGYTSLVAPTTDVDYDMNSRAATVVKVQPVLGGYEPSDYESVREWAIAPDGAKVPISIVYRRDTPLDGSAPALIYGYGAYEYSSEAVFRSTRLSLLDRGFVYAIAHVRGGGEMGREWYEQGRLEQKRNTFTDFIAVTEHLIAKKYTSAARCSARGGSAGGLLMGAIVNMRPDLYAAIIASVPFVDVVTTMLDASLPLTVTEWEEWGDPREAEAYARLKSYSPYDNVRDEPYPAMLVTTGLNDPRVQYWEPVKWVAKLREHSTSGKPIILRVEMGAGHAGPSGRYDAWRDEAIHLAFLCHELGVDA
jgi:oligopeptidase B